MRVKVIPAIFQGFGISSGFQVRHMDGFAFGEKFRIHVFGSSHGESVGVEIEGCPAGLGVNDDDIQLQLDRRKPGQSSITTGRREDDRVIIESGIKNGRTTGERIRLMVKNKDARSSSYEKTKSIPRPGHADYPAYMKYGQVEPGGGFFSGRMTAAFVMAGAVAKKLLEAKGIRTMAFARQIGKVAMGGEVSEKEIVANTYANAVHAADAKVASQMQKEVEGVRDLGDSVGGIVECRITGVPAGSGEPMFASFESVLSQAVFAIPAAKGIEFGSGFAGSSLRGSQNNDAYSIVGGKVVTSTNNSGGILGGLATGSPIIFRVAFKPTSSIFMEQKSVDLKTLKEVRLRIEGRHDPCVAIRAVCVVENIAAICMADAMLRENGKR
jgi:chorismate synthase